MGRLTHPNTGARDARAWGLAPTLGVLIIWSDQNSRSDDQEFESRSSQQPVAGRLTQSSNPIGWVAGRITFSVASTYQYQYIDLCYVQSRERGKCRELSQIPGSPANLHWEVQTSWDFLKLARLAPRGTTHTKKCRVLRAMPARADWSKQTSR